MIHRHIKSLPHHPKRVIAISIIIAAAIGVFGYLKINQKPSDLILSNMPDTYIAPGNGSASQNLTLAFLAGGRIKSVLVKAGDTVKMGQVLAILDAGNTIGVLTEAQAALEAAQANYQKVINGATGPNIDVAKAAVNTAQVNLDGITKQQNLLVQNARLNLLNSTLTAKSETDSSLTPPAISGTYTKDIEGTIILNVVQGGTGGYFTISGIASGTGTVSASMPETISVTGLFIEFPATSSYTGTTWDIDIPNQNASNYLSNYNAYQSALQNKNQYIAGAQATLDQVNTSLSALRSAARPEDVASAQAQVDNAKGAVQIAEAAYANTIITAPADGTIVSIAITPGQIAMPNVPAIEFLSSPAKN